MPDNVDNFWSRHNTPRDRDWQFSVARKQPEKNNIAFQHHREEELSIKAPTHLRAIALRRSHIAVSKRLQYEKGLGNPLVHRPDAY